MRTELENRGIADALIVCCDGLQGLRAAIRVSWPDATVQTSRRAHVQPPASSSTVEITRQPRSIYTSPTVEAAHAQFRRVRRGLARRLSGDDQLVGSRWTEFSPFLELAVALPKRTSTPRTRSRASTRKASRERPGIEDTFPNEQTALKVLYNPPPPSSDRTAKTSPARNLRLNDHPERVTVHDGGQITHPTHDHQDRLQRE
jgi:transposase-like protein